MEARERLRTAFRRLWRRQRGSAVCIPDIDFASGLADGAWLLYGLVYCMEPAICVEIGSARGLSACYMGMALKRLGKGKLYAIDPHAATKWNDSESVETYRTMRSNLKAFGVEPYVKIIRKRSADASVEWSGPIDLLFIDGDHSYDGVKRDWELFSPHVSAFGVVVFHDTLWGLGPLSQRERPDMGVPLFVEELRAKGYPVITVNKHYGLSMTQMTPGGIVLTRGNA